MDIDIMLVGNGLPSRLFPALRLCDSLPARLDPLSRFRYSHLVKYVDDLKALYASYDKIQNSL